METKYILAMVLVITIGGISLYRRYMKKKVGQNSFKKQDAEYSSKMSNKDIDDYEPYAKKY